MKKFLYSFLVITVFLLTSGVTYLSIFGIETTKFNNLIVKEIKKKDPRIELELQKIKIKLDLKKIQLYLSTSNPKITYENIKIPVTKISIYSKIGKILNTKIEISQISFTINKFKIKDIQKIAIRIKPSNFKKYLLKNLNGGEVEKALFNLRTDKDFKLIDYKANGSIKKVTAKITNNFTIKDVSFNFIADNNLTLINSINANYQGISITNGSIDIEKKKNLEIKGKFNSQFKLEENQLKKLFQKTKLFKKNKIDVKGSVLHVFSLKTNKFFKIIDYQYKSSGTISQAQVIFNKTKIEINFNKKNNNSLILDGFYSTNKPNFKKFKIKNNLSKKNKVYFVDLDLSENIFFDIINFQTNSKKNSNVKSEINVKNNKFIFKTINFKEEKSSIFVEELVLNNRGQIEKLKNINLITFNNNKENNNLKINFGKKILISGKKYDSTYLLKILSEKNKSNLFENLNNEVEINIETLITRPKIPLNNFYLIGSVKGGKFDMISSKSEFSEDKYLDVSLKKYQNNKKILEIYSDSPEAMLDNYKFFEGIKDGKLLYNSIIDETGSVSKLTIENFKVIKAPALATLLTIADLGGIADLLSGQGMSFEFLEINLKENSNVTTVEEILALGSSVSLHMKGYIEKKTGLISLSGTLVPAKTLNSLVSKIPVIGNILVGDKIGEGVFGVSFKMKGLPGKLKTTVNPVKTITPRFITRAFEKMKKN